MSAQGTVSSTPARRAPLMVALVAIVGAAAAGYVTGKGAGAAHEVMSASPAGANRLAFVREAPCGGGLCQTLWIGSSRADATSVDALAPGERCEEIAWAADGFRVGFVVNGYQLRIFDGMTTQAVGRVNLLDPDTTPSSRIARGVTFSQNGASVTFDDCPRHVSGCKSSMAAIR